MIMPLMTKHGERDPPPPPPPPLLHNTTTSSSPLPPPPHQHHNTTTTTYNIMGGGGAGDGGGLGLLSSLAAVSANNNNHNNNNLFGLFHPPPPSSTSSTSSHHQHQLSHLLLHLPPAQDHLQPQSQSHGENINQQAGGCYFMDDDNMSNSGIKAKIMAHPHYPRLLAAYVNCHKVGAPAEVVAQLEQTCASEQAAAAANSSTNNVNNGSGSSSSRAGGSMGCNIIGEDPALDQFMEAYCEMLTKYEQELTKPIKEAMLFINRVESQFKALTLSSSSTSHSGFAERVDRSVSSDEDEVDANDNCIDPQAEERELKDQLLRRYSGYLGSLKQEFLKKRKKGKLPKEARQQLLDWWSRHYKWPYPSESQKLALAESTGLDQKQINNWFINQRKRHWKPSEEMQFVVMDASHPHYYMEDIAGHPHFPMDCTPMLL